MLVNTNIGDANKDHVYWESPEDINTTRTVLKSDRNNPLSEESFKYMYFSHLYTHNWVTQTKITCIENDLKISIQQEQF